MDDGFTRTDAWRILVAIAALFVLGTLLFMWTLGEPWHAALYRTIVTASLTGLDTTPRGLKAEAVTILVVLCGVAIFGYFAAQLFDEIAHGVLGGAWREKRRRKMIDELRDHIIVCGYGRVGRRATEEFRSAGVPYVILDSSEDAIEAARENDDLFIHGDGADDADLERAGIDRARGLIVASDDDADNLYITLSAKVRRPDLTVIARASSEDAERKLKLAGADRVVTPYTTAGRVMANLMIKPQVTAFVNVLTSARETSLSFEEIEVKSTCGAVGLTIGQLDVARQTGAYIVAIRKRGGDLEVRPTKETRLEEGDVIVGIGAPDEIRRLERMFEPREAVV
ncbi:MAG TPA: TrkA family potassium uptake protein [Gaiellaceae bacterium]|nr:TrkA family potassium uptake protein [Gaiellaceae bacterium]